MPTPIDPSENGHIREHLRYGAKLLDEHIVDTTGQWGDLSMQLHIDTIPGDDPGFVFACHELEAACHDQILVTLPDEYDQIGRAISEFEFVTAAVKLNLFERPFGLTGPLGSLQRSTIETHKRNAEEQAAASLLLRQLEEAQNNMKVRRSTHIANMGATALQGLRVARLKVSNAATAHQKAVEVEAIFPVD